MDSDCLVEEDVAGLKVQSSQGLVLAEAAIMMKIQVDGDRRRLFTALTEPEFLETWVCFSASPDGVCLKVRRVGNDLHLEMLKEATVVERTIWAGFKRGRYKLSFSWVSGEGNERTETAVQMRLRGNFGSSILDLFHQGFRSTEECDWYKGVWIASLAKLQSVLRTAG